MIKSIKEFIWGKEPVLWFPDERSWKIIECDKMPSLIGMQLPTPSKNKEVVARNDREYRSLMVLDFIDRKDSISVKTKYLDFTAILA